MNVEKGVCMDIEKQIKNIVKYNNEFNTVSLINFNAVELDFLMLLCSRFKENGTKTVDISFKDIKKLSNYKKSNSNKEFKYDLESMNKKLNSCTYNFISNNKTVMFTLFPTFIVDYEKSTLTVDINERFYFLFNQLTSNFTRFELREYISLRSIYSKECYRRLKQYRTTGKYMVSIDDFRKNLSIPESYKMSDIDKRVLKPIINELSFLFKNLKIEKIKNGRKVSIISFTFTEEINTNIIEHGNQDKKTENECSIENKFALIDDNVLKYMAQEGNNHAIEELKRREEKTNKNNRIKR